MDENQGGGKRRIVRIVIAIVVLIIVVNVAINVIGAVRGRGDDDSHDGDGLSAARAKIEASPLPDAVKRRIQERIDKAEQQRGG
jgi:hypothetical protein